MSKLSIYQQDDFSQVTFETTDSTEIARQLNEKGIRFEHWPTQELASDATPEAILEAYAGDVQRLKDECGFSTADVVRLTPDHPEKLAFRNKFLSEHQHVEDEVRFFVEGQGLFYLHLGDQVWVVLCEKNDLISVPDGARHWFDMGPEPRFTCIRLFSNPEGWVAEFTGDTIAEQAPRWESLMGSVE